MSHSGSSMAPPIDRFEIPDWPGHVESIEQSILGALRDGSWGKYQAAWTDRLEAVLSQAFHQSLVTLCCSGTLAVELALRGIGIVEGDAVVLAAYDFPGNFRAIEAIGARPILVDVLTGGWTLDDSQLDGTLSFRPRAVLASHLHGQFAACERIRTWCDKHQIAFVEDACQVPGGKIAGKPAGSFGHAAALSFGGSKLLTAGRGGAVLTACDQVQQRVRIHSERGNQAFPMSQLQAAALLPQIEELGSATLRRAKGAEFLLPRFRDLAFGVPIGRADETAAWYKVPLLLPLEPPRPRQEFARALQALGIPIDAGFRGFSLRSARRCDAVGELANARIASERTLLLHHTALLLPGDELARLGNVIRSTWQTMI